MVSRTKQLPAEAERTRLYGPALRCCYEGIVAAMTGLSREQMMAPDVAAVEVTLEFPELYEAGAYTPPFRSSP